MSYPEFLIDKRVLQRNIHKGLVDSKEFEKGLSKLPDVANNAESCAPDTRPQRSETAPSED